MALGHNTGTAQELMSFVERLEKLRGDKDAVSDDEKVVRAEMAAAGFDNKTVTAILKIRRAKPHDFQEAMALLETYLHALGMAKEPPLARFTKNASVDRASLDSIVEYMEPAVPPTGGHIDIVFGKATWRLTRDLAGSVLREEVVATAAPERKPAGARKPPAEKPPVPDVDEDGARQFGKDYAIANRPVIDNPFPFGDPRRARFDEGWREGAGGDGMGPDED